ncbi:MAG: hypothetical protein ABR948_28880 [Bradyrhizobium sp.]
MAAKQHYSGADLPFPPPWTFRLCWSRKLSRKLRHRLLGAAILAALASCLSPRGAQAGDLEDCNSSVAEKIEAGCTAIINNPARTPEDALKAFANRGRLYNQRSKFDAALADAEAALQLNAQSVLALLVRGYAYQRKNNFDAALADFDQAGNPLDEAIPRVGNGTHSGSRTIDRLASQDLAQAGTLRHRSRRLSDRQRTVRHE